MHAARFFDGEGWRDGILETVDGQVRLRDSEPDAGMPRFDGVLVGGFTDHHVHLQLVNHELLAESTLGRVVDLGANPEVIARLGSVVGAPSLNGRSPRSLSERSETKRSAVIEFAGAFLTPVGGYPSDRDWAPEGSFREIADADAARAAVAEMADAGASLIKVASNRTAGPVFEDDLFRTIVEAAEARSLRVVAHAEGRGEAQRVARLGAASLAHAPFTQRLVDTEIAAQAASVSWISTLSIHGGADLHIAQDNVRRFHAAGGTVLYGTDMGNGPTPVGLHALELRALQDAGIRGDDLLRALAPQHPLRPGSLLLTLPSPDADPALARPLTPTDLEA